MFLPQHGQHLSGDPFESRQLSGESGVVQRNLVDPEADDLADHVDEDLVGFVVADGRRHWPERWDRTS